MSSSAEPLSWSAFRERPTGPPVTDLISPALELAVVLRHHQQALHAERMAGQEEVDRVLAIAAMHAALVHRLGVVLAQSEEALHDAGKAHRRLTIVHNQMSEALDATGLSVVDPTGWSFDEAEPQVTVVDWRHGNDFTHEVVAETIEPIVHYQGTVIRNGRVIMGAPVANKERA